MAEPVRLRVVFQDADILSGSQMLQGLQRCWFLLRPDLPTIADLAAQLRQTFDLHTSCPHGLIVSMDGFVLPPFESTCILKDDDIIMINKDGVIFKDVVKFCGSQDREQVLQSRGTLSFNNRSLTRMDPLVNLEGDGHGMVFCNGSAVHLETTSNEKMSAQCKMKRSNNIRGSDYTLAIKDSHGYESDTCLHGNIAQRKTTSNEMVHKQHKKKNTKKSQTLVTSESKDFQADSQRDKGHFILPMLHKETLSSGIIQAKRKKKHFYKLPESNDSLSIEENHGNSQRDEQDVGHHVFTMHEKVTLHEKTNSKHKRKHCNKLKASVSLSNMNSQVDSQNDESHHGITTCKLTNAKRKIKRFKRHQGSDDILATKDPCGDSKGYKEDAGSHGNIMHNVASINEMMSAKRKKSHFNKLHTSDNTLAIVNYQEGARGDYEHVDPPSRNVAPTLSTREKKNLIKRRRSNKLETLEIESKEIDDGFASKADANVDANKTKSCVRNRNTERKKARKRWRHTHGSKNNLIEVKFTDNGNQEKPLEHENAEQNSNLDKDIVPVIVRPGHIRFETSDESTVQEDELVETLQWNGTTSKKRGQKWGREKSYNKQDLDTSNHLSYGEYDNKELEIVEASNKKSTVEDVETYKASVSEQVEPVAACESSIGKELKAVQQLIDYESFLPLNRLPEEGDILVYRVVELSSSWCPELSPFRVGTVSSYESSSSNITLHPLPEYPFIPEEMSEEWQANSSLYEEDRTLEIDFQLLLDVRLLKAHESEETATTPIEETQNASSYNNHGPEGCSNHTVNAQQLSEGWEVINRAIEEKKAQLQKKYNFTERNSSERSTTGPWSYKALRRNALGPTLAMLRSSGGGLI